MKAWWQRLALRERRLLLGGGLMVLMISAYHQLWLPLQHAAQQQRHQVVQLQQQLAWMQQQAPLVHELQQTTPTTVKNSDVGSALSALSQANQITLKRIQPQGDRAQVELDALPFERLINWLVILEQQEAITVQQIELQAMPAAGMVQIKRLILGRTNKS